MADAVVSSLPVDRREAVAIAVWGTVVTVDIRLREDDSGDGIPAAFAAVEQWLNEVDALFSTFRDDSPISEIRSGRLHEEQAPRVVRSVLSRARMARNLTDGAFDPWAVPGGVDPSGLVKGWAAQEAADILVHRGFRHLMIDAGGDIVVRGGVAPGRPWVIGVRHPDRSDAVATTVSLFDGTVASSGTYERGEHIVDPARPGYAASGARAATVVGPDAGLADALATALMVRGIAGRSWFGSLPGWSAAVMTTDTLHHWGPAFSSAP